VQQPSPFHRGQTPGLAQFDDYDGDAWVSRQRYVDESWSDLVALVGSLQPAPASRHCTHAGRNIC
jgi:hypothetical protein